MDDFTIAHYSDSVGNCRETIDLYSNNITWEMAEIGNLMVGGLIAESSQSLETIGFY
jgi:hypothetical protein